MAPGPPRCQVCGTPLVYRIGWPASPATLRRKNRRRRARARRELSHAERAELTPFEVSAIEFSADHAGHPLGPGMPMGSPLREDTESHRVAWMRIIRDDPCAYCGRPAETADHVVPQNPLVPDPPGGKHTWLNLVGACASCNTSKSDQTLLTFLRRRGLTPQRRSVILGQSRPANHLGGDATRQMNLVTDSPAK